MLLSKSTLYKPSDIELMVLDAMSYSAAKLWNIGNYEKKNYKSLGLTDFPNWYYQKKNLKNEKHYKMLPSQTAQELLSVLQRSWKSFFVLLKTKGVENPHPPRFKHNFVEFSYLNNAIKIVDGGIRLSLSENLKQYLLDNKNLEIQYLWLKFDYFDQFLDKNIKQIRFLKVKDKYRITVIHEINDPIPKIDNGNYLFIDIGINNLLTCVDTKNNKSFIVGKKYLTITHYFDKKIAHFQSINSLQQVAKGVKYPKNSKRINNLFTKKSNSINDYIHKVTTYIANYCNNNNINTVIVGDIKNIRKNNNLGSENNQKLHSLPFKKIYDKLEYKLKLRRINFIKQKEAYSSQCSPSSKKVSKIYAAKANRKQRGLYIDKQSIYNADAVGAYNIGRLALQQNKITGFNYDIKSLSNPVKVAV